MDDDGCETGLLLLADELIDMILSCSSIDHKDLSRCAQVCRRLNVIASGNELWKRKALARWAFWRTLPKENWSLVYRDRILTEEKVLNALQAMAKKHYTKPEVYRTELEGFVHLGEGNMALSQHVDNCLIELVQGDDCKTNLTFRYYARKVQTHLKINRLKKEWENLLMLPEHQQKLEEGAMLISKWILSEEEVNENEAYIELDEISQLVRNTLSQTSRTNTTIASSFEDTFARGENEFIAEPTACLRILECVKHVMFEEQNFRGNTAQYYKRNNSMLHQVLKCRTGNPITLAVVFVAVASKLGVKLEPVNFPNHFLLRWRANQDPEADDATAYKYIDCFNGGRFLSEEQCLESLLSPMASMTSRESLFPKASPRQVFIRMVANIINSFRTAEQEDDGLRGLRSSLDLVLFLNPDDDTMRLLQARIQVHLGVDLEEAIDSLETLLSNSLSVRRGILESLLERANQKKVQRELDDDAVQPKSRSDPENSQVGFKVGMVMRHKLYNYGCVIYGWDPVCKMDELWIQQMGVDRSPNGRSQPFYNVLGDDSSTRYAAHENLREDPDQPLNPHPDLGKHFKGFTGTRYIPNESLQEKYPEDVQNEIS